MSSDRMTGSLAGLAIGDCLGAPVEGMSAQAIRMRFGTLKEFQYAAPIWTDDTQQALVLVEAGARFGTPDPSWVGERLVAMSHPRGPRQFGCHRGTGRGFRAAVCAFEASRNWRTSGQLERAGNGAAMRIAPVAVALDQLEEREFCRAIADISLLTHRELRAIAGALAVGWLTARLAEEPGYPVPRPRAGELLGALGRWVRDRETWLADEYPEVAPYRGEVHDLSALLLRLAERWNEGWQGCEQEILTMAAARLGTPTAAGAGYVLCSVPTAMCMVLMAEHSFEEALVRAVNLGGDADTVGAMVGAMAGAAAGLDAIPSRWRCVAGYDALLAWGRALDARANGRAEPDLATLPDLLALEQGLWRTLRG